MIVSKFNSYESKIVGYPASQIAVKYGLRAAMYNPLEEKDYRTFRKALKKHFRTNNLPKTTTHNPEMTAINSTYSSSVKDKNEIEKQKKEYLAHKNIGKLFRALGSICESLIK